MTLTARHPVIDIRRTARSLLRSPRLLRQRIADRDRKTFQCPICGYAGAFLDFGARFSTGTRRHAECPGCGSVERHRLLWLALDVLAKERPFKSLRVLHFAPEGSLRRRLSSIFATYHTADLQAPNVDYNVDMCDLPFPAETFDLVMACHVLEHIRDTSRALNSLSRVLSRSGVAILPVPIVRATTIEYAEPNLYEHGHVRAPGLDFYDTYRVVFPAVDIVRSRDCEQCFQTWIYEDRTHFPTSELPFRQSIPGERHEEFIPLCYKIDRA